MFTLTHSRLIKASTLLLASALTGCSLVFSAAEYFEGFTFPWPQGTPIRVATESAIEVVFEEPDKLAVLHGFSCASSDREGVEDFIRIQEDLDLAALLESEGRWITNATVLLNGYQGQFLDGKRNLLGVGAAIANIDLQRTRLRFEGGGVLADGQFDAAYEMCYTYTVLAWNRLALDISVNHEDQPNVFLRLPADNTSITSLNVLRNYRDGIDFIGVDSSVAILPRGSGMAWTGAAQLLQSSYALGTASPILESHKVYGSLNPPSGLAANTSRQGAGGISWDSSFIFKPNDWVKKVFVAEMVSLIGGDNIAIVQPPFLIEPDNEQAPCGGWLSSCIVTPSDNDLQIISIVVDNLPYDRAVPVLSGWSLGYADDDHSIERMGINIDSFSYQAPSAGQSGTLRYTLKAVTDNGDNYRPALRHRVSILGISLGADSGDDSGPGANITPIEQPPVGPAIQN